MAISVRHQCPRGAGGPRAGLALSAPCCTSLSLVRLAKRAAKRTHLRCRDWRDRQHWPWRGTIPLPDGIRSGGRLWFAAGPAPAARRFAAAAGGFAAHSHIRSLDLHLYGLLLRTNARVRRDPLLSREPLWLFGRRNGPSDHALADSYRDCGADSGSAVGALSAGLLGGIGLLLFAAGLASLALLPPSPSIADVVWRMALSGLGFGLFQTPNNRTMIAAAPRERSGWGQWNAGDCSAAGPDRRRCISGAAVGPLSGARYPIFTFCRRRLCVTRSGTERAQTFAGWRARCRGGASA